MQTQTNEGELDDELQKSAEEKLCREESQDGQPVQADGSLLFLVCTVLLSAKLTAGVSGQALKNAVLQRPSVYVGLRLNGQM